jgi:fatty acid photodecarboxylase
LLVHSLDHAEGEERRGEPRPGRRRHRRCRRRHSRPHNTLARNTLQKQKAGPSSAAAATPPSRRVAGARRRAATTRLNATVNPAGADKYDYIIVGGGTAGCVLANRLTANGDKTVLVLEAGGPGGALETIPPAGLSRTFLHPRLDWALYSTPQQTLGPREVYLARGRTLGGSSATNATLYLRGSAADYDGWQLDGWRASDVLPWFVCSENNNTFAEGPYHGKSGPMRVDRPRYQSPLIEAFYSSARGAGLAPCDDFNDWSHPQDGFGEYQVTHYNGRRADAFQMYLKPVIGRGNLKVVTGARATKVHWLKGGGGGGSSSSNGASAAAPRAGGVEFALAPDMRYQSAGGARPATYTAELAPGGEVLMCGGAVATPQLLMLSGVGDQRALKEVGVAGGSGGNSDGAGVDSPHVGANLQDHPATLVTCAFQERFREMCLTHGIYGDGFKVRASAIASLLLLGRGPLATTGCDRGAFVRTTPDKTQPDLQIRFVPAYALDPDAIQSYIRFGKLAAEGKAWPGGVTLQLLASRPKSRGSVSLASADPYAAPNVDLGYFTDPKGEDMATLIAGVELARRIAAQPALAQYVESESWPGEGVSSKAEIEEYVRRTAVSGNAVVGSCRMGVSAADSAVSSADFKVWGVQGVRVVDASLLPVIPGGQTGACVVMAAERAAALLVDGTPLVRPGGSGSSSSSGSGGSSGSSSGSKPREPALV